MKGSPQRILVREVNWIGDAVMTLPALSAIRRRFPDARLSILARPWVADLFLHHPGVDEILIYDHTGRHRGIAGKWRLARELRQKSFDTAILFQNALDAAVITFLAGIPVRVGYERDGRGWLLSDAVTPRADHKIRHHVNYYLDLLQAWTGADPRAEAPPSLWLNLSDAEKVWALGFLEGKGVRPNEFIGLNPGATYGSSKRWLPEYFAEVADRLMERTGMKTIIFGGPAEQDIAEEIAGRMEGMAVILAGQTTLRQLMTLISMCGLLITNDSGPMHLGAAFNRPLVALFGSTSPEATGPYSSLSRVLRATGPECAPCFLRECKDRELACMKTIKPEDVVEVAIRVYDEAKK